MNEEERVEWERRSNTLSERIGPGFWRDANGNVHVSLIELLQEYGLDDTPENRERMASIAQDVMAAVSTGSLLVVLRRQGRCPACGNDQLRVDAGVITCLNCAAAYKSAQELKP